MYTWDIDNQVDVDNYEYDKTGNLVKDKSENMLIRWTYYNKVKSIDSVGFGKRLEFGYDANGDRVVKYDVKNKRKEVYVRDAQGNTLAVYEIKVGSLIDSLFTREFNIYGTERIGYLVDRNYLGKKTKGKTLNLSPTTAMKTLPTIPPSITPLPTTPTFTTFLGGSGSSLVGVYYGKKRYELSDWLGNVRVVVSDKKVQDNVSGVVVLNYKPEVVSVSDYYSFGSEIAERSYTQNTHYRYSFNGKEDIREQRFMQDYGARWYNKVLGRFISADPLIVSQKKYPWLSSYQFASNTPIWAIDRDGLEPAYKNEQGLWITAGDNLQHKPTAKEVEMMKRSYHIGVAPESNYLVAFGAIAGGASLGMFVGGAAFLIAGIGFESAAALELGVGMLTTSEVLSRASDITEVVDITLNKGFVEGNKVAAEKFIFIGLGKGKDYLVKKVTLSKHEEELMKVIGEGYVKTSEYIYNKFKEENQNNTETQKNTTKKQTSNNQNKNISKKDKNNKNNSKKNISKPMYN